MEMHLRPKETSHDKEFLISYPHSGRIAVCGGNLFAVPQSEACIRFIDATFRSDAVHRLEIRPKGKTAFIDHSAQCPDTVLKCITRTLSMSSRNPVPVHISRLIPGFPENGVTRITRYGRILSTWEVMHCIPGRVRLRHPALLDREELIENLETELAEVAGVLETLTSAHSASITLRYDGSKIILDEILELLGNLLPKAMREPDKLEPGDGELALKSASLAVAAAADYLFPSLKPVSGGLLIGSNIPGFIRALEVTRQGKVGVEVIESIFVPLAFATSSFFSGALMSWLIAFWPHISGKMLNRLRKRLLLRQRQKPHVVMVKTTDGEIGKALSGIQPGDAVLVRTGMTVPVDGEVLEGRAMVDESCLFGPMTPVEKVEGSCVCAASTVLDGKLTIMAKHTGDQTASARISAALMQAAEGVLPSRKLIYQKADEAAAYALVAGCLALFLGGPTMTAAVMRPECVTAPQLAASFSLLDAVVRLSRHGVIVRDGAAIESILTMDALVVAVDGAPVSQDTLDALCSAFPGKIVLVEKSGEDGPKDSSTPVYGQERLTVSGAIERARVVQALKRDGMRVAYVGVTPDDSAALDKADIAISGPGSSGAKPASIGLASTDIRKVVILLDVARAHINAISEAMELIAPLNLIGQGGAFVAGFSPLLNVVLSSLGVLLVLKLWNQRMGDFGDQSDPLRSSSSTPAESATHASCTIPAQSLDRPPEAGRLLSN